MRFPQDKPLLLLLLLVLSVVLFHAVFAGVHFCILSVGIATSRLSANGRTGFCSLQWAGDRTGLVPLAFCEAQGALSRVIGGRSCEACASGVL